MPASPRAANPAKDATRTHKVGPIGWIGRSPVGGRALVGLVMVAAAATAGCAAEAAEADGAPLAVEVATGTVGSRIFDGEKDDDQESLAGVVALRVGAGGTYELCTGALVAPNVVLTARHCVTKNIKSQVSCDEHGRSANGEHVAADEELSHIAVFVGASPGFAKTPSALARAIVAPTGPYLCDSDIAVVVLDKAIEGVKPLPLRIHSPARAGETIRSVGYGQNDKRAPIGTRFRKDAVSVLAQGAAVSPSRTPLGAHEFEVGKSICQGDSGGPAISEATGAVIGVVSRGGNCDEDFGHIYTTTAGFASMFEKAFAIAGASPTLEPGDAPSSASATGGRAVGPGAGADDDDAASAASCSASPSGHGGASSFATGLGVALAAASVLAARRRRRA